MFHLNFFYWCYEQICSCFCKKNYVNRMLPFIVIAISMFAIKDSKLFHYVCLSMFHLLILQTLQQEAYLEPTRTSIIFRSHHWLPEESGTLVTRLMTVMVFFCMHLLTCSLGTILFNVILTPQSTKRKINLCRILF